MKALHILKIVLKDTVMSREKEYVNEAIKELEELQNNINSVIEEIDYALAKPDYAKNYLGNAKRLLENLNEEKA